MRSSVASKLAAGKHHKKPSDALTSSSYHSPSTNPHSAILDLQSSVGNRAVNTLVTSLGGGAPLSMEMRGEMEQRFGADFSRVRLHTDAHAAQSATELNAKAYTVGNNIVFNEGRFSPETTEGRRLLAHELAHVVQQSRGGATPTLDPHAQHENAAETAETQAVTGSGPVTVGSATNVGVARQLEDGEPLAKRDLKAQLEEIEQLIEKQPMKASDRAITKKVISKIRELAENDPESANRMLEGLEIRLEQMERGKTANSETSNLKDRALLEQKTPHPNDIRKAAITEGAKLGELGSTDKAKEEGIVVHDTWEPPQKFKGDFGQGIDKKGERDSKIFIIEDKYGSSKLGMAEDGTVQMSNRWVGKKIAELQLEGDTKAARELLQASQEGRLQGVVYSTQQKGGKDVTSRRAGAYLRDKLGDESISKSGLITYASSKVYGAYIERLKQLEGKYGVSLPPLMQPKGKKGATPASALARINGPSKKLATPVKGASVLVGGLDEGYHLESQPASPEKPQPTESKAAKNLPQLATSPSPTPSAKATPRTAASALIEKTSPQPPSTPIVPAKEMTVSQASKTKLTTSAKESALSPSAIKAESSRQTSALPQSVEPNSAPKAKAPDTSAPPGMSEVLKSSVRPNGQFEITPLPPGKTAAHVGVPDMTPVATPTPSLSGSRASRAARALMGEGGAVGSMMNEMGISAMQNQEIEKAAHAVAELQPKIEQARAEGKWILVVTVFDYQINPLEHVWRDPSDVKRFHRAYLLIGDSYSEAREGTKEERESTTPTLRAAHPQWPLSPTPELKSRLYGHALWKVISPAPGNENNTTKLPEVAPETAVSGRWKQVNDPSEETMEILVSGNRVRVEAWSKMDQRIIVSVRWDPRVALIGVTSASPKVGGALRESQFQVIGKGLMIEHYIIRRPESEQNNVVDVGQLLWVNEAGRLSY